MVQSSQGLPHLWLRAETKPQEHRTALTPSACKVLLAKGFKITVEESKERIFDDKEYADVGCTMAPFNTWPTAPADAYIVGLKELQEDTFPLSHTHIFFAHCYKNQAGWKDILKRFDDGKGCLLDLEFLVDEKGRRVAAFGYHAGFAGSAIGIDVWCHQQLSDKNNPVPYPSVTPYPNETELITYIKSRIEAASKKAGKTPTVMVMGALGRCGTGAVDFCVKAGIPESHILKWDMAETKRGGPFQEIIEADIFVNCIYLSKPIPPFLVPDMLDLPSRKLSVLVDVSCDTTNPHNPIPVYKVNTTFVRPTVAIETKNPTRLDVVAIDHLPTMLPRESSEAFCNDLLPSLMQLADRSNARVWVDAEKLFKEKVESMKSS
ncbi:saccharopine dehydrogenase [Paraphysoderma sedebokerense]|nr:saccharopine dehydrogenase [Paraphysoderma sedebokerense]